MGHVCGHVLVGPMTIPVGVQALYRLQSCWCCIEFEEGIQQWCVGNLCAHGESTWVIVDIVSHARLKFIQLVRHTGRAAEASGFRVACPELTVEAMHGVVNG